jgi:hypothetical protein
VQPNLENRVPVLEEEARVVDTHTEMILLSHFFTVEHAGLSCSLVRFVEIQNNVSNISEIVSPAFEQ